MGKSHTIFDKFPDNYHSIYTVHGISMNYTCHPIYNIESNDLLIFLTNDPYWRGGLTLNRVVFLEGSTRHLSQFQAMFLTTRKRILYGNSQHYTLVIETVPLI